MRKGFTLLEVLLSVAVMSTGVLSVVVLYSMGLRETRQSREDVASAAYANAVMAPLVSAIGQTNLTWSSFKNEWEFPDKGWGAYYDSDGEVISDPSSKAGTVVNSLKGVLAGASGVQWPTLGGSGSGGLAAGLVVTHEENSAVVKIAFRAAHDSKMLMSAPLYYTEARFQGASN